MQPNYSRTPKQTNLAYNMQTVRPEEKPQRRPGRIMPEPARKSGAKKQTKTRISVTYIFSIAIIAVMMTLVVSSYAKLSELTLQTASLKSQYTALQAEKSALDAKMYELYDMNQIAEYAELRLGMVKADAETVEYISINQPDTTQVTQNKTTGQSLLGMLRSNAYKGLNTLIEYFN